MLAERTWLTGCLDAPDTGLAVPGTAAAEQMRIAERQEADSTGERVRKGLDKVTLVSSSGERNTPLATDCRNVGGFGHESELVSCDPQPNPPLASADQAGISTDLQKI